MARQFKSGQLRDNLSLSGSFSGSFQGDGSNLTGITPPTSSISSSFATTASYAQSGDGIFSGSFSGSYVGDGSGITGVTAEWDGSHLGDASITGSLIVSGSVDGIYSPNQIKAESIFKLGDTAFFRASPAVLHLGLGSSTCAAITTERDCIQFRTSTPTSSFGGFVPFEIHDNYIELNTAVTASTSISSSGWISASYFVGDGSQLTNLPLVTSASYALTSSYSFYAVSASHEIIKEVSSSYADTASFAQSGDGIFSGSFSGSYVGDGSSLTGLDPFPYTGSAIITGSLEVQSSTSTMYFESGSSVGSDDGKILIKSTGGSSNISLWRTDGQQAAYLVGTSGVGLYYDDGGDFGIEPSNNPAQATSFGGATSFYMNSAGHVGINTNNPLSRFYVVGKIATTTDVSASGDIYGDNLIIATDISASGNISASNNLFTKQLYVEGNLAVDYDFTHNCISLGNASDCLNLLGTSITASNDFSSSISSTASFVRRWFTINRNISWFLDWKRSSNYKRR